MVDNSAVSIRSRDAVVDQALVHSEVWEVMIPVWSCHAPAASGSSGMASFSPLMRPGGWDMQVRASGAVRPSSAAQLSICGQSRCSACTSSAVTTSASTIAVIAELRSISRPGSQDTCHVCSWPGASRAVCRVVSLLMVSSWMVRVMGACSFAVAWVLMSRAGPVPVACFQPLVGR